MNIFVITLGSIGVIAAYVLGLWLYRIHVEQQMIEWIARKWRDDKANFELWIYNMAIKVTKKEINNQENKP
jgi:hypothetical protein